MKTDGNDNAFAATDMCDGLSKREYFASMIMQGMAHLGISECGNEQWYAKRSVEMADALIEELNKAKE